MNAVPALPIKPEMPATTAASALHRDESQTTPSFMATLHKAKADEPPASSDQDPGASPAFSGEDQNASVITAEEPREADTAAPQAKALTEEPVELIPGAGVIQAAQPAIGGEASTGAAKRPTETTAAMPKDEQAAERPSDGKTADASPRPQTSGLPPTGPQTHLKDAAPAVFRTPDADIAKRDPGAPAVPSPAAGASAKTAAASAPAVVGGVEDSAVPAPETGEQGMRPTSLQPGTERHHMPAQAGPGRHGPLAGDAETVQGQPASAVRTTVAPVTRLSDASHQPANMTTSPSVSQWPAALGPEPGNAASESPDGAPSARPAGDNAGAHDGPGLSADRERAEDQPRRWSGADLALDTARNARSARLESDSRADWIAPGDRQVMSPVNKPSPTIFVEKAPTPTAEAFRSQNLGPIVERIAVSVRGNQSEARIALKPDHLGSIRLQIATDNTTVNIKIMTEFPMARDLLESHLPQLKADLQQQGLELEEFKVTLDNEEQHFRRGDRRQPGAHRSLRASGGRDVPADQSGQDLPQKPPAVGRSSATGVDFFA